MVAMASSTLRDVYVNVNMHIPYAFNESVGGAEVQGFADLG